MRVGRGGACWAGEGMEVCERRVGVGSRSRCVCVRRTGSSAPRNGGRRPRRRTARPACPPASAAPQPASPARRSPLQTRRPPGEGGWRVRAWGECAVGVPARPNGVHGSAACPALPTRGSHSCASTHAHGRAHEQPTCTARRLNRPSTAVRSWRIARLSASCASDEATASPTVTRSQAARSRSSAPAVCVGGG